MGHPTYHVYVITIKKEIIWTGGLPHLGRLPHLPGVPPLHVNRPLTSVVAIRKNYYGTTICVPDQTNTKQLPLSVSIDKLV